MPSANIFLKISFDSGTLQGEATMRGFEQQIEIESVNWTAAAKHLPVDGGSKVSTEWRPGHVSLSKFFDKASGALYSHMFAREKFKEAVISVVDLRVSQDRRLPVMELVLRDGYVENVNTKATEAGSFMRVSENITLTFEGGRFSYRAPAEGEAEQRGVPMYFPLPAVRSGE